MQKTHFCVRVKSDRKEGPVMIEQRIGILAFSLADRGQEADPRVFFLLGWIQQSYIFPQWALGGGGHVLLKCNRITKGWLEEFKNSPITTLFWVETGVVILVLTQVKPHGPFPNSIRSYSNLEVCNFCLHKCQTKEHISEPKASLLYILINY